MDLMITHANPGNRSIRREPRLTLSPELQAQMAAADELADRIASHPEALAELRRLICEGLEGSVVACDDEEAWLASLADGIRSRAAARE